MRKNGLNSPWWQKSVSMQELQLDVNLEGNIALQFLWGLLLTSEPLEQVRIFQVKHTLEVIMNQNDTSLSTRFSAYKMSTFREVKFPVPPLHKRQRWQCVLDALTVLRGLLKKNSKKKILYLRLGRPSR